MITCGNCGTENPPTDKFCGECGSALTRACPACGTPAGPTRKFCGECGTQLTGGEPAPVEAAAPTAPELRLVSVLFCDLVGYTGMSEGLDADEVRELLSGYFDVARTIVGRHGGVIQKFIGDAVMAVWGTPAAREDDAERAVRAALELVDAVEAYGEQVSASGLRARAGVVTGRAAATETMDEGIVIGDRVNTAARIQSVAEPGAVFVDDTTRSAAQAAIAFRDAGLFELKGKAEPVHAWRAERAVAGAAGSQRVDGLEAGFVGRDAELRLLKELFHATADRGTARLVSVVGAAGSGKTRLRWEFFKYIDGLADTMLWHTGRCLAYGEGVAYWALAQMVRQRFGIAENDPPAVAAEKLEAGLERWIPDAGDRVFLEPRLAQLVGAAEGALARDDLFGGWRLLFERLAEQNPVVLVIEDLQWADPGLLDFLDSLLDWSAQHAIFILTLARPEIVERRPGWAQRRNATSIGLDPLDPTSMSALLADLVDDLPDDLSRRIVAESEGMPLYAVEMIRALVDRDAVQPVGGRYRLVTPVDTLDVPSTLTALLAGRIDGLRPDERSLVKELSVLGVSFPRAAVDAIADVHGERLDELLTSLVRREILEVRADPLSPERGQFQFAQNLLRTVAYETLTRRERKARHLAVAAHLREVFADDGAEVAEVVAAHYRDALEAAPDADDADVVATEAANAYERAGDRAAGLGASSAAAVAYRTAADLAIDPDRRAALQVRAGRTAAIAARHEDARTWLTEAIEHFRASGDAQGQRAATAELARALFVIGNVEEGERLLVDTLASVPDDADDPGTAAVLLQLSRHYAVSGRHAEAQPLIDRAIRLAESLDDAAVLSEALTNDGVRQVLVGNHRTAQLILAGAVEVARETGRLDLLSRASHNLGQALLEDDRLVMDILVENVEAARRLGDVYAFVIAADNLSRAWFHRAEWDEIERMSRESISDFGEMAGIGMAGPHIWLAMLAVRRGDPLAARDHFDRAVAAAPGGDLQEEALIAGIEKIVLAAEGTDGIAGQVAELMEEQGRTLGWRFDPIPLMWPVAIDAALAAGDLDGADRLVSLIAGLRPGERMPYLAAELPHAQARLAAARGEHDGVEDRFLAAIEQLDEIGYVYWAARARLDLAEWLAANGRRSDANDVAADAVPVFEQVRCEPDLTRAQAITERLTSHAADG